MLMKLPNGAAGLVLRHLAALVTAPYQLQERLPNVEAKIDRVLDVQGKQGERIARLEGIAEREHGDKPPLS